ncbi:protein-glutamine gamma-glutamyltransferase E-like [Nelusetta ayraudi]|uniref:protein-glutamine gamma-glutamyltransferase E-like n=1 Tax=Nelusetta ayraudi TaxID=303726 RepID=UPI003F6F0EF8
MAERFAGSVFVGVDLKTETNNGEHHTSEIAVKQLVLRRGQSFKLAIELAQPFDPNCDPLNMSAQTGSKPTEEAGTLSHFGIPDRVKRSPAAKAVWMVTLDLSCMPRQGILNLVVTPPADAPIGEYSLTVEHKSKKAFLATLVLLFNPWCTGDTVYLSDEKERQEYVMKEDGIIYRGSGHYLAPMKWDFGQFEDHMLTICMKILDLNHKHNDDPAADVAARSDATYVSRVISAMINSEDDYGVLQGRWGGPYIGGKSPSHWSGSHDILLKWLRQDFHRVKYGQCWVFAGVMCTVMRFLGIPCRVVTNFDSAHDTNHNLLIDTYHDMDGVRENDNNDSIWNFHVWCEGWMKRPDLFGDGKFDGWQVVDPTPQEMSDGIYCCGPAPVKAIFHGETQLNYDVPFVFAEVNADCVDWLILEDGSHLKCRSDTKKVGKYISTKEVGSMRRLDITNTYKHAEGSKKERDVFHYATTRDYSKDDYDYYDYEKYEEEYEEYWRELLEEEENTNADTEENINNAGTAGSADRSSEENPENITPRPKLSLQFKEEDKPENGKDVKLKLVVRGTNKDDLRLSVTISVQAMRYNGTPAAKLKKEVTEATLQPSKDLSVPILIPFLLYTKPMLDCESLKVSAVVTNKLDPDQPYLAEDDVVLVDPPISVTMTDIVRVGRECLAEVTFTNPINLRLTNCTMAFSGSGLLREEYEIQLPDLELNKRFIVKFPLVPYKDGQKTLLVDFDCSSFRDIKASCTVDVKPAFLI